MTHKTSVAALSAAFCLFLSGAVRAENTSGWQLFEPEGAGFSVLMPGQPQLDQKQGKTGDGIKYVSNVFYYETADESQDYMAKVVIYDEAININDGLRDLAKRIPGTCKVLFSKDENLNGHPGKMLVYTDGKHVWVDKFYLTDKRLFEVKFASSNPLKAVMTAAPFLDSFRISE